MYKCFLFLLHKTPPSLYNRRKIVLYIIVFILRNAYSPNRKRKENAQQKTASHHKDDAMLCKFKLISHIYEYIKCFLFAIYTYCNFTNTFSPVHTSAVYSNSISEASSGTAYNVLKDTFLPDERFALIKSPVSSVTYCCSQSVPSA